MDCINILKECYIKKYDVAIMTTYNFEIDFFENVMLRKLMGKGGIDYISVYVDNKQISESLEKEKPRFLGSQYLINTVKTNKSFHPKIILLLSKNGAKLIIGSCNLTKNGILKNDEVFNIYEFDVRDENKVNLDVIQKSYEILKHVKDISNNLDEDIWNKCEEYTYLREKVNNNDEVQLIDNYEQSILEQVKNIIDEEVERIDIAVPFFDKNLETINTIRRMFNTKNIVLNIQNETSTFSFDYNESNNIVENNDINVFTKFLSKKEKSRYHGKVYRFITKNKSYILYGSSNCTKPALTLSFVNNGNFECNILEEGNKEEFDYFFDDLELTNKNEEYKNSEYPERNLLIDNNFSFQDSILEAEKVVTRITRNTDYKIQQILVNDIKSEFKEENGFVIITTDIENSLWNDSNSRIEIKIKNENKEECIYGWYWNKAKLYYNREKRKEKYKEKDIDISEIDVDKLQSNPDQLIELLQLKINEIQSREEDKIQTDMISDFSENGEEESEYIEEYEEEVISDDEAIENLKKIMKRRNQQRKNFDFFSQEFINIYGPKKQPNNNDKNKQNLDDLPKTNSQKYTNAQNEEKEKKLPDKISKSRLRRAFLSFIMEIKEEENVEKIIQDLNFAFSIYCFMIKEYKIKDIIDKKFIVREFKDIVESVLYRKDTYIELEEIEYLLAFIIVMALDLSKEEKYYFHSENDDFLNKVIPQHNLVTNKRYILEQAVNNYCNSVLNIENRNISIQDVCSAIEIGLKNINEEMLSELIEKYFKESRYEIYENNRFVLYLSVDKIIPENLINTIKKLKEKITAWNQDITEIELVAEIKNCTQGRTKTVLKYGNYEKIIQIDYNELGQEIGKY